MFVKPRRHPAAGKAGAKKAPRRDAKGRINLLAIVRKKRSSAIRRRIEVCVKLSCYILVRHWSALPHPCGGGDSIALKEALQLVTNLSIAKKTALNLSNLTSSRFFCASRPLTDALSGDLCVCTGG